MMNVLNPFVSHVCIAAASILAGACAAPAQIPARRSRPFPRLRSPTRNGLRRAGIQSVQVFSNGARVPVATNFGEIYLRYPAGLSPTAFAVYVDGTVVEVDSDMYNAGNGARYEAAIKAILPESIKFATDNNTRVIQDRFGKNRAFVFADVQALSTYMSS
jgi:hypothetical protein